ncbi:ATP-binding protein [bacterium]|nr:ATP-binding protein [bacterium]
MTQVTYCNITRRYRFDTVLEVACRIQEIERVRSHMTSLLDLLKYSLNIKRQICLALDEAMTNAIEHGSLQGQLHIEVAYSINPTVCILQVIDHGGCTFNPEYFEKLATMKGWGLGGRGIYLIKSLMDEVYYFFHPGKSTTLVMIKNSASDACKKPS